MLFGQRGSSVIVDILAMGRKTAQAMIYVAAIHVYVLAGPAGQNIGITRELAHWSQLTNVGIDVSRD
jgi:hypothetical protein